MSITKTVTIEFIDDEKVTYSDVTRVEEGHNHYTIHSIEGVLAVVNKEDVRNLLTKDS